MVGTHRRLYHKILQILGKSVCGREENMACSKQLLGLGKVIRIPPVSVPRIFNMKSWCYTEQGGQPCQQPHSQQLARAGTLPGVGCFLLSRCTTECHGLFPKTISIPFPRPSIKHFSSSFEDDPKAFLLKELFLLTSVMDELGPGNGGWKPH